MAKEVKKEICYIFPLEQTYPVNPITCRILLNALNDYWSLVMVPKFETVKQRWLKIYMNRPANLKGPAEEKILLIDCGSSFNAAFHELYTYLGEYWTIEKIYFCVKEYTENKV